MQSIGSVKLMISKILKYNNVFVLKIQAPDSAYTANPSHIKTKNMPKRMLLRYPEEVSICLVSKHKQSSTQSVYRTKRESQKIQY